MTTKAGKFSVGDFVRKRHGKKIAQIYDIDTTYVYCRYVEGSKSKFYIYKEYDNSGLAEIVHAEDPEATTPSTSGLYTFAHNGAEVFASLIGKNEQGHFVLEIKSGGGIVTKKPDEVKEVLPYTVGIRYDGNSSTLHYEVPKSQLEKGDVIINSNGNIGLVTEINTQKTKARDGSTLQVVKTRLL